MTEITDFITDNRYFIRNNIARESVEVYCFLQEKFKEKDVVHDGLFQFVYRSFYRLDNAGLPAEFKNRYFELLEKHRNAETADYRSVVMELYNFRNLKNQKTLQFSFVTKLFNTVNPSLPVYDSEVARVFKFRPPFWKLPVSERLDKYLQQLNEIKETYHNILMEGSLDSTLHLCRDHLFFDKNISDTKALDFIFWSAGKILKNPSLRKGDNGFHTLEELDEIDGQSRM